MTAQEIALNKVSKEIEKCAECKKNKIGKAVPGEGNANAEVCFIGEAPGKNEAETGRPFIGRAGKILRELIKKCGLKEEQVYITSPVKRLPVYVTPTPKDIEHGRIHLSKQLAIIKPKIIVLLGNVACKAVLPDHKISVSKDHGRIIKSAEESYFICYHPAAVLHQPNLRPELTKDFSKIKRFLKLKAS